MPNQESISSLHATPQPAQRQSAAVALSQAVRSKGFTPPWRDLPELLNLLGGDDDELAEAVAKACRRMGAAVLPALQQALPASERPLRGRLTELVGRLAALQPEAVLPGPADELLISLLGDADLKTQLNAATALGRRKSSWSEQALLAALAKQPRRELHLALVRAVGKVGGAATQAALRTAAPLQEPRQDMDKAAARVLGRAQLILQREQSRALSGEIAANEPLDRARPVWLSCRDGLEQLLVQEAKQHGYTEVQALARGRVQVISARPLADLWRLRLFAEAGLPLAPLSGPVEAATAAALSQAEPLLRRLTKAGPALGTAVVRYRIHWPDASKAQLWSMATRLMAACPGLVNDPTQSTWDLCIHTEDGHTQVELRPKQWADPRFGYRQGFVPAASHPTIAAALARVAAPTAADVVWDPFTGSGSELIECALLAGAVGSLHGTDMDPAALAIAAQNIASAQLLQAVHLTPGDFSAYGGPRPTLIVTNPPMGRRVQRGQVAEVLERFATQIGAQLAPGGRLVWLAPLPQRTNPILQRFGFSSLFLQTVDMGGFSAELQHLVKAR